MEFGVDAWTSFEEGIKREWLLTNGIGGFSSSTIIGANTRKYHGLLIGAVKAPHQRSLVLSKINETVELENKEYYLNSDSTGSFQADGYKYLEFFENDPFPSYTYRIKDLTITKQITLLHGKNAVIVSYSCKTLNNSAKLSLAPLINFRDYHHNSKKNDLIFDISEDPFVLKKENNTIYILSNISTRKIQSSMYYENMFYEEEAKRGLNAYEDHFIPCILKADIKPYSNVNYYIMVSLNEKLEINNDEDYLALIKKEQNRVKEIEYNCTKGNGKGSTEFDLKMYLIKSAEDFIVKRDDGFYTIIAGYPWFTDWGRDTMIAFTGLTLCTEKYDIAKNILLNFARYERYGLLPNVFPDKGEEPYYNTVDAPLWFFEAVWKYYNYAYSKADEEEFTSIILPCLMKIADSFILGTIYNIKMDTDYLITAGDKDTQLTWMDAKAYGRPVTPRFGKAVEINSLFYNALCILSHLCMDFGLENKMYSDLSEKVQKSFVEVFWNEEKKCLYDCIYESGKDDKIRPNQIYSVALSFQCIYGEKAKRVVETVLDKLYTPYGLRSLDKEADEYIGKYVGTPDERDTAYHQGTVWSHLMGPFITAYIRVSENKHIAKTEAIQMLKPLQQHLRDACLGSISEIFDGDWPHRPNGCFAQAWSVGEILKCLIEDINI